MDSLQPVPPVAKKISMNRHLDEKCCDCIATMRNDNLEKHWNAKHGKKNNSPNPYAKILN
jgi:hypothetical protein